MRFNIQEFFTNVKSNGEDRAIFC